MYCLSDIRKLVTSWFFDNQKVMIFTVIKKIKYGQQNRHNVC